MVAICDDVKVSQPDMFGPDVITVVLEPSAEDQLADVPQWFEKLCTLQLVEAQAGLIKIGLTGSNAKPTPEAIGLIGWIFGMFHSPMPIEVVIAHAAEGLAISRVQGNESVSNKSGMCIQGLLLLNCDLGYVRRALCRAIPELVKHTAHAVCRLGRCGDLGFDGSRAQAAIAPYFGGTV